jgi:S1-C subfamily serine protease
MNRLRRVLRTPFGAALTGGLVVAILGWIAIATGMVRAESSSTSTVSFPSAPSPSPAANASSGRGLTVNQIYKQDSPGVAFIQAESAPRPPSPFDPFGSGGGGTATGSGFVVDTAGHILTNAHVVDGASKIEVTLGNGQSATPMPAQVVGKDDSTDIALLKVNAPASQLHPLPLGDSSSLRVGDPVVAIGNPFDLDRTVTAGIVSALQRQIKAPNGFTISNVIQTDAAINPGNSGGPLIDAAGRVVGINSQIESPRGGNVGIGFAEPIDTAKQVVQQLLQTGHVQHAFLGITGTDVTPEIAKALNLPVQQGALVQTVVPNGPAAKAGIRAGHTDVSIGGQPLRTGGDIITAIDGNPVQGMDDVVNAIDAKQPGDQVSLTVIRGGARQTIQVTLGNRPAK